MLVMKVQLNRVITKIKQELKENLQDQHDRGNKKLLQQMYFQRSFSKKMFHLFMYFCLKHICFDSTLNN